MDPLAPRVAARFTTRRVAVDLDEKMKALLLKLRKGADASLSQTQLWKVLALLGGWRVEPFVGLVPVHTPGTENAEERKELLAEDREDAARRLYDDLKAKEVKQLPAHPEEGHEYVMGLEPFKSWENSFSSTKMMHGARYMMWVGAPGWRITDPQGKIFELLPMRHELKESRGRDRKKLLIYDLMAWLKKHTTYLSQINELLGMEEHVPAAKRTRENTGTCAVCFRNIKLIRKGESAVMALHGYNRPGHGYIVGRCWGGEHPPYELSCEATKLILKHADDIVTQAKKYIATIPTLTEFDERKFWSGASGPKIIKKDEVSSPELWGHYLKEHMKAAQADLHKAERERNIYAWLVEHWEQRELPREGDKEIDWFEVAMRASGKG
jgi:hypothetical protein